MLTAMKHVITDAITNINRMTDPLRGLAGNLIAKTNRLSALRESEDEPLPALSQKVSQPGCECPELDCDEQ
jgi:hypothetical protein